MPEPTNLCHVDISLALISVGDLFVMQLRDFDSEISDPGTWGFFAGRCETGEQPRSTMLRELREELSWQPELLIFLGVILIEDRRINVFCSSVHSGIPTFTLQEGVDMDAFDAEQIKGEVLFSNKLQSHYRVNAISLRVFDLFYGRAGYAPQGRSELESAGRDT